MPTKQTYFQKTWLDKPEYKEWLSEVDDNKLAFCKVCKKSFKLSNMAEDAIKSHAGSDRHKTFMKEKLKVRSFSTDIHESVPAPANNASPSSCSISVPAVDSAPDNADAAPHVADNVSSSSPSTSVTAIDPASSVLTIDPDPVTTHIVTSPAEKVFLQSTIGSNVLCSSVSRAEIIWALFSVCEGLSTNSSRRISQTFLAMFPDHPVVEKFQLAQTKLMYITNFGLAPHFQDILKQKINNSDFFVVSFDESLNKSTQTCQMDLGIRFWNKEMMQVEVRYWNSEFLGHVKHTDLVEQSIGRIGFIKNHSDFDGWSKCQLVFF